MNIENIIKEKAVQLKCSKDGEIYIAPDIPEKLLLKWEKECNQEVKDYALVMSHDITGKFLLTGDAIYYSNFMDEGMQCIQYKEIMSVTPYRGGLFSSDKVVVKLENNKEKCLDGCIDSINIYKFKEIFSYIIEQAKETSFTKSKQNVSLYELPDELKLLYLKILCNYAYVNDEKIDAEEYNAIGSFSVRMEIGQDSRKELRNYMNNIDQRKKTVYFLQKVQKLTETKAGEWDVFRYSLLQDVLYMHNIQNSEQLWRKDGFIGSLMKACFLRPEQLDTMLIAVKLNQKMQVKNADLMQLKKDWKVFLEKIRYTSGYVPSMYLFCSGSVYGIENYKNFLQKSGTSQEVINKQRELILHDIIMNNQKTLNVVIDDIGDLATQLEKAIQEGKTHQEKLQQVINRLQSLKKAREKCKYNI